MSVILQKDRITGETLVYETTNYRDKKTGKSGTKKELLGWLAASSQADNYKAAVRLFDEAPDIMEDIDALTENSFAATKAVGEMLDKKEGDDFSREEIITLFGKFSSVLEDKDAIFDKLSSFAKDLIEKAAYVVRENEFYKEDLEAARKGMSGEEWDSVMMARKLETCEKLIQSNDELQETSQKLIEKQNEYIADLKEQLDTKQKLIDTQDKAIKTLEKSEEAGQKLIDSQDNLIASQCVIIVNLIEELGGYRDVSDLENVRNGCAAQLSKYDESFWDEMKKTLEGAGKDQPAPGDEQQ